MSVGAEITETRQVAKFPTSAPPDAPETSLHALVPILVRADLARQQNWCGPGLAKYWVHMQMARPGWIGIGIGGGEGTQMDWEEYSSSERSGLAGINGIVVMI